MNHTTVEKRRTPTFWAVIFGCVLSSILVGAIWKRNHSGNGFSDDGYGEFLGI